MMRRSATPIHICTAVALLIVVPAGAATLDTDRVADPVSCVSALQQPDDAKTALRKIARSISKSDIGGLRNYFLSKVFLNLPTGEHGYFSSEQAYYILKNFFSSYSPLSFTFSSSNVNPRNAYGVGPYRYVRRGQRGSVQVFVSLVEVKNDWKINQLTIARR